MSNVAVVTGGFGALGRAVAAAFQAQGWTVASLDFAAAPAEAPGQLALGQIDLADAAAAQSAMCSVWQRLGGIDALLNIAGSFRWEPFDGGTAATWEQLYRTNVLTAVNASRAALPYLSDGAGRIVNIGANSALRGGAGVSAYTAAKSAVHRLTESLAEELKPRRITVNAVLPSIIDTPANRRDMPDADHSRWVAPADLAAVIAFLASPQAAAITGALLPVTGAV